MEHESYMQRCVDLAYLGQGNVSPNPMVGCVIVKNGLIIGEGYHSEYGGKHAEIKAIESVLDQKEIENSTVYISLEPCVHHGKTAPCVNELINRKIKNAVIGSRDSNPIVGGKGGEMLKKIGSSARFEIQKFLDKKVYLDTFVKVDKDWRSTEAKLKKYGY